MNNIREDIDPHTPQIIPLTDEIIVEIGAIIGEAFHEMMANDHEKLYNQVLQSRAVAFSRLEIVQSLVNLLKSLTRLGKLEEDAKILGKMDMLLTKIKVKERNELRQLQRVEKDGIASSIKNLTQAGIEEVLHPVDEEPNTSIAISGRREMPTLTENEFANEMLIGEGDERDRITELPTLVESDNPTQFPSISPEMLIGEGDERDRITELPTLLGSDKPTQHPLISPEAFARRIIENFDIETNSGYSLQAPKLPTFDIIIDDSVASQDKRAK